MVFECPFGRFEYLDHTGLVEREAEYFDNGKGKPLNCAVFEAVGNVYGNAPICKLMHFICKFIHSQTLSNAYNVRKDVKYKVETGTPVCVYAVAFPKGGSRRVCLAGAPGIPETGTEDRIAEKQVLKDDGQWHKINLDARSIRRQYPDVRVLQGLYFEVPDPALVRMEHAYYLDRVVVRPEISEDKKNVVDR